MQLLIKLGKLALDADTKLLFMSKVNSEGFVSILIVDGNAGVMIWCDDMYLLDAELIQEVDSEFCVICKETKKGVFLIIHLTKAGFKTYLAICESCLNSKFGAVKSSLTKGYPYGVES
jgi:hypothetical protein